MERPPLAVCFFGFDLARREVVLRLAITISERVVKREVKAALLQANRPAAQFPESTRGIVIANLTAQNKPPSIRSVVHQHRSEMNAWMPSPLWLPRSSSPFTSTSPGCLSARRFPLSLCLSATLPLANATRTLRALVFLPLGKGEVGGPAPRLSNRSSSQFYWLSSLDPQFSPAHVPPPTCLVRGHG